MGIVQKSSFRSSILLGIGIMLGFITAGILLPNYLTEEQNGLLTLFNSYSLIYSQLVILGLHTAVIRFFPHFKNDTNKHYGFLTNASVFILLSFLVFAGYYYITKPYFKDWFSSSPLFDQNYFYILPLTFFTLYFYLFDAYSTAQVKSVRGFFLKDVLQRVFILIAIVLFIILQLKFNSFVLLYCLAFCLPTIIFFFILAKEKQFTLLPRWDDMYTRNWRYMAKVSGYSLLLGISWVGISNLDAIMIERMLDLKQAGIYGRNMFFGILVSVPYRAIHKIASGVISNSFKEGNISNIKDVYYKSTITQMAFGLFILGGLWINIENIYHIIPTSYEDGKYVILFIGLGNLFTMTGGVNTAVISFSPHYRWNTIFVALLLIMVVVCNLIFIPWWGISGAALAVAISMFIYNLMMYILLLVKYKFQPFSVKHLLVLIISSIAYLISYIIPTIEASFIGDILIRSIVFTLIFGGGVLVSKVSPDINKMLFDFLKRLKLPK